MLLMKRLIIYLIFPTSIFLYLFSCSNKEKKEGDVNETWVEVGKGSDSAKGISNNNGKNISSVIAIDGEGKPVVAWSGSDRIDGTYQIYVKRFNGTDWEEINEGSASGRGISSSNLDSLNPAMAIDNDGYPVIAWEAITKMNSGSEDPEYQSDIYIKKFNGQRWEEIGVGSASGDGVSSTPLCSQMPTLAINQDNEIFAAWQEVLIYSNLMVLCNQQYAIYVKNFNGLKWVEVGNSSASDRGISEEWNLSVYPSISINKEGNPIISWYGVDCFSTEEVTRRFKTWTGSNWEELSNPTPEIESYFSSGTSTVNNHEIIYYTTWTDSKFRRRIDYRQLDDHGTILVTWIDSDKKISENFANLLPFKSEHFYVCGNGGFSTKSSLQLVVDRQGYIYITWVGCPNESCTDNKYQIYVKKLEILP
jgi:predicted GNAT superfamily acetyltransferase